MTDNMGRGILAPRSNSQIQDGAREMRTIARTTAAAISDLDRQVNGRVGQIENLSGVNRNDIAAWRQATAEIQNKIDEIEQNLEPGEDGKDGDPGPPGPGGSIALEETDPGCFVDSEITWMQWPESGGLPAVWNPNTQSYENPITVDTSVGTRVFVGDTMIYGDTGWREISLASDWTGTLLVRRTGNLISWKAHALDGANATSGNALSPPFGFQARPRAPQERPLLTTAESPPKLARTSAAGAGSMTIYGYESLGLLYGSWSWITENDWPSTLPGEPA